MRVGARTSRPLTRDGTYKYILRREILRVGIIRVPVRPKVNLRHLIQRKVDQRVRDTEHGSTQTIIQSQEAFPFLNYAHRLEQVEWVLGAIVVLRHRTEDLSLHARAHHPERIRDAIDYHS